MNPKLKDYINVKWLHKELVEKMFNAKDEDRPVVDKALELYAEIIEKWRRSNGNY